VIVEPADFYSDATPALQQGDVVLAPIGRVEAAPWPASGPSGQTASWRSLDDGAVEVPGPEQLPPLRFAGGVTPAMVVTHDCQLDKEYLARYRELRADGQPKADAMRLAEADPDLDRFLTVSPLLPIAAVRPDAAIVRAGEATGFFAVPARHPLQESAVDLGYQTTVDRNAVYHRFAVLSEQARTALRFALARIAALRTPQVGFELEQAVGARVAGVRRSERDPTMVVLELSDGEELELVMQPQAVRDGGAARTAAPDAP
jgi:hypothetical protein